MKPVILGMNNPISSDPHHALYPSPEGCTGHRLWTMLNARTGCSRAQYLEAFERRNLLPGKTWSMPHARLAATQFIEEMRGRYILVLGAEPRDALRLPRVLVKPVEMYGSVWRLLPHPSGRNLWYNVRGNREVAELLLEEMYKGRVLETAEPRLL